MPTRILLISDIHANYPALLAVADHCGAETFDLVVNGGDTTVYATFPNETLDWLRQHRTLSILGNTDRKVIKILQGKEIKKPRMEEKRVMYTWTADRLTPVNRQYLAGMAKRAQFISEGFKIGVFHGSPADDDEFLFADTPAERFKELAAATDCDIILAGHSHSPFYQEVNGVHFINPGSVGRMFDSNPEASYATIALSPGLIEVKLLRCPYDIEEVIRGLRDNRLPPVYEEMFRSGRKLN